LPQYVHLLTPLITGWGWMTHRNVSILEICSGETLLLVPLAGSSLVEGLDLVLLPWEYHTPPGSVFLEPSRQTRGGAIRLHQNENACVSAMKKLGYAWSTARTSRACLWALVTRLGRCGHDMYPHVLTPFFPWSQGRKCQLLFWGTIFPWARNGDIREI